MPRIDLKAKMAGSPFIHDIRLDGMRHGRALQPTSPERRVVAFDEAAIQARFPDITIVRNGSFIGVIADREADAVIAIAAAGELVTWSEPTVAGQDIFDALGSPAIPEQVVHEQGDAASVEGQRIELTVTKPYIAHASIAPSCAIATWRDADHLEVLSHTQAPHGLCDGLGIVFGIEPANVTVIHKPGAGTYGHSGQDDVALDAALLAKAVPGVPVRVAWSRADDFQASPLAPAMSVTVSGTLGVDNRITAMSITSLSQAHARRPGRGGFAELTNAALLDPPLPTTRPGDVPPARGGGADRNANPLYNIPNLRVAKRILTDWPMRTSALRGLGAFTNVYALEALIDEMADAAGACPLAFRLAHLIDVRAQYVIERAAEMAGWPGPEGDGEAIGLGFAQYKNRSAYCAVAMRLKLDKEISLISAHAAVDAGEIVNPDGIRNQIEGSIIQATSWTLKEAVAVEDDRVVTDGWQTYPILTFSEIPHLDVELVDRKDLPSLGVGETAIGPTGAAIGNAVRRAIGLRLTDLPLTRDRIAEAINRVQG